MSERWRTIDRRWLGGEVRVAWPIAIAPEIA
jgi:hypothetical protein